MFSIIDKLTGNISGLIWVSGSTGNPDEEYLDLKKCETNIRINFLNPVLLINKIAPKMVVGKKSFITVLTSVAGLRGRSKRLFYSSAKSALISYLSGLRQKLNKEKRVEEIAKMISGELVTEEAIEVANQLLNEK